MSGGAGARFSQKDADTYLNLWKNLKTKWEPYLLESFFNPAPLPGQPDAIDRMLQQPDSGIEPSWLFQSPIQMNKALWEDPHVRHAFARSIQSLGFEGDQAGSGFMANVGTTMLYMPLPSKGITSVSCGTRGPSRSGQDTQPRPGTRTAGRRSGWRWET